MICIGRCAGWAGENEQYIWWAYFAYRTLNDYTTVYCDNSSGRVALFSFRRFSRQWIDLETVLRNSLYDTAAYFIPSVSLETKKIVLISSTGMSVGSLHKQMKAGHLHVKTNDNFHCYWNSQ